MIDLIPKEEPPNGSTHEFFEFEYLLYGDTAAVHWPALFDDRLRVGFKIHSTVILIDFGSCIV